ncbi:hypothetical protein DPMN_071799 [Dreissena polymorpha]|uniref:Reverse transcriptase RNase H-like domain-containing protein n=1 Tax=Dreissena polymorpha TaxID=45954 RepID=A0A9D3Z7M5_DREPO|nr:hypothetical protein DPMN_071799 [Dreissena polymorpha]
MGRQFIVRSDHQALVWLFSMKEPNGKIARWIEILAAFHFSIEYLVNISHTATPCQGVKYQETVNVTRMIPVNLYPVVHDGV